MSRFSLPALNADFKKPNGQPISPLQTDGRVGRPAGSLVRPPLNEYERAGPTRSDLSLHASFAAKREGEGERRDRLAVAIEYSRSCWRIGCVRRRAAVGSTRSWGPRHSKRGHRLWTAVDPCPRREWARRAGL